MILDQYGRAVRSAVSHSVLELAARYFCTSAAKQLADMAAEKFPARLVDQFGRTIFLPMKKIGDTITVRRPLRFADRKDAE